MTGAVRALAERVLGRAAAERCSFESLEQAAPRAFEYRAAGGRLEIRATDALAAAVGLHAYLRDVCGRRVCWDTELPLRLGTLPAAPPTRRVARAQAAYYLNFCTFSYTAAYWDWPRWEREIDWMALHGITMPLAITGHEAVLHDVYTGLGIADADVRAFLGGPGYLPFQFMGCLDGFAGTLPASWISARAELGARIVARELELGMTPVLPSFTGHVPAALAGAGTTVRDWTGFKSHFLDPADERFGELSSRVVRAQRERFGTAHLYAADPFIEMTPPSGDPAYLAALARTALAGLRAGDDQAIWVMQTWPFSYQRHYWTDERVAALLDAVPDDALLLLDLWAEHTPQWQRFDGFRGKRWIWCALHDFGGRADLFGDLRQIHEGLDAALASSDPPDGVGLAMEATETNAVVYELITDQAWESIAEPEAWIVGFARQRYGAPLSSAEQAWRVLLESVYATPAAQLEPQVFTGVVAALPRYGDLLDPAVARAWVDAARWYDGDRLYEAWDGLLLAAEQRPDLVSHELAHDLVAVGATAIARTADALFLGVVGAFADGGHDFEAVADRFLDVLLDLDDLLDTRPEFRLRTWEAEAASWAGDDAGRALLLDNARRIVSVWTTPEHALLTDYSARPWSGLVGGFYRARWRCWIDGLALALATSRDPDENALRAALLDRSHAFLREGSAASARTDASAAAVARRLFSRFAPEGRRRPGPRSRPAPTPTTAVWWTA